MTNRTPTRDLPWSIAAPLKNSRVRCRVVFGMRLLPLLAFFVLLAGAVAGRAATSAVITLSTSPTTVSNTYNGIVTLQINGLTNGVTNVVVQKFLDVNTNRVIDSHDLLVQQFQLTAGQANMFTNGTATVTVSNSMPADISSTPGQMVVPLNFQNGDFIQNLAGQYLYKVSSRSGLFNPVTNLFVVTNAFPTALVTGTVENASSAGIVSNAIVLLFSSQGGTLNFQAGTVAGNNGNFSIGAPPGSYLLVAAKSNFVANLSSPPVTVSTNSTNSVSPNLTPSTTNITGKVVSAGANSVGLPGLLGLAQSTNNIFSLFFTRTNGAFTAPVVNNAWTATVQGFAAAFQGYLTSPTNLLLVVSNKLINITNSLPQETAIFYGSITNNSGNPMPGVYVYASDNANHQSWALTDIHGNYVLPALGGTNTWQVNIIPTPNNPGLTNSTVFGPGYIQTNINAGQAIQENFVVVSAPNSISGTVSDVNGNPIAGAVVFATGTNFNGVALQAFNAVTSASGNYSLNVSSGTWTVGVSTNSLISLGFSNFAPTQTTNLLDANAVINFSILLCGEINILTSNLPNATLGAPYDTMIEAESCEDITNWIPTYGITLTSLFDRTNVTYAPGTKIISTAGLQGYLLSDFSYGIANNNGFQSNCTAGNFQYANSTATFLNISATVNVSGPIASNTTVLINKRSWKTTTPPSQQASGVYQTTLFRAGPDSYTIGDSPMSYSATNGMLITSSTAATTNTVGVLLGRFGSFATAGFSRNAGSTVPYTGTNGAVVWLEHGTNWGQYLISAYGPQSTNLPRGLSLAVSGSSTAELMGTPTSMGTNNGLFTFTVAAVDTGTNVAVQTLTLQVNPATNGPALQASSFMSTSNVFELQVNPAFGGQDYTLQMNTNLLGTNWVSILTTNANPFGTNNSLVIPDTHATNPIRFYRIKMGP